MSLLKQRQHDKKSLSCCIFLPSTKTVITPVTAKYRLEAAILQLSPMTTIGSRSGLRFCSFIVILLCTLSCTCSSWDTAPLYRQNGDGSELFEGDGFDGLHSSFTNREWDTDTSQRDISVKCDKCITIATLITVSVYSASVLGNKNVQESL